MQENYVESISLTPRIRSTRKPSRTRVRNWKRQLLLLCPAKLWRIMGVADLTRTKQNLRVFWKPMNPPECVWGILNHIITKTILQEKVRIHCSIIIWFTYLFLCLKLWKFLQRKQRWTRNGKNWKNFRRGTWRMSEVRKRWSMKQGRRALQFNFASWMDMSFEKCWIGGKTLKIQRSSCAPRWYCKRWFWVLRSIHWTRIFSISNDSRQDHGYHLQIAWLRWTTSRRSISLYPSEDGRCSQINENSKIGMSRYLDSSTTTQMANIMVQYGRPGLSS